MVKIQQLSEEIAYVEKQLSELYESKRQALREEDGKKLIRLCEDEFHKIKEFMSSLKNINTQQSPTALIEELDISFYKKFKIKRLINKAFKFYHDVYNLYYKILYTIRHQITTLRNHDFARFEEELNAQAHLIETIQHHIPKGFSQMKYYLDHLSGIVKKKKDHIVLDTNNLFYKMAIALVFLTLVIELGDIEKKDPGGSKKFKARVEEVFKRED